MRVGMFVTSGYLRRTGPHKPHLELMQRLARNGDRVGSISQQLTWVGMRRFGIVGWPLDLVVVAVGYTLTRWEYLELGLLLADAKAWCMPTCPIIIMTGSEYCYLPNGLQCRTHPDAESCPAVNSNIASVLRGTPVDHIYAYEEDQ